MVSALFHTQPQDSANLAVMVMGIVSVFLFLILTKQLIFGVRKYQAVLLSALLPCVWIISTNLLAESILLPLYLGALVLTLLHIHTPSKINLSGLILVTALLIGGHIQMIVWLPTLFALACIARPKASRKIFLSLAGAVFLGILLALIGYALIFSGGERSFVAEMRYQFLGRAGDHYSFTDPVRGLLLGARNLLVTMRGAFGTATLLTILAVVWVNRKNKRLLTALFLLSVSLVISGSVWTGDFMMRRVVFAAPLLSLILVKTFPRASWLVLALVVPVTLANGLLSLRWKSAEMLIPQIEQAQSHLPTDQVLITTRYLTPFTYPYQGTTFYAGRDDLSQVESLLKEGKRVFLDSSAVTAPYLLPVGNNLHVTSVKTGRSETQELFKLYAMDIAFVHDQDRFLFFYELHFPNTSPIQREITEQSNASTIIQATPGTTVSVLSSHPLQRLHRARIDYGDPFSWLIAWSTQTRGLLFFTYADARGLATTPLPDQTYTLNAAK